MYFLNRFLPGMALCACVIGSVLAQTYPASGSTIRVVVPFSAGSGTDMVARTVMEELQKSLKTTIVVDNKPGANGAIAAELVSRAAPDGYTLVLGTSSGWSTNPWLMKKLSYDPLKDFTPISRVTYFPFILVVSAASPIKTLDDFLKRAQSGGNFAMGYGNASGQVAGGHLMKGAGFKALSVPYKSTPPALTDLVGGQFDFMFVDMASSQGLVQSGRLRAIAVMADRRSELMPELPALGEKVPGFTFVTWGGLLGPAGLPPAIVERLNSEMGAILRKQEVKAKMGSLGLEAYPSTAPEFAKFLSVQLQEWGDKVKDAGIERE
ncbi:MAG: tripartite tricarboxylate transporter substrate binding protein [Chloroflexi bacterium]|jgi:tripartite-type tricarboxylate transporter receptor subunit TctC|nr:tripartite tricarboxylate transporter substrate binding protein [Chloroflexota bacterium]